MAVTPGRLQDPTKKSFFRTDDATSERGGGIAPQGALPSEVSSPRSEQAAKTRLAWSRGLLGLWTIIMLSTLFEPAPNPNAVVPLWANVLGFLFLSGFFTTVWGLAANHSWALKASLVTGSLGLGMAIACGVTDHHPAFWWGYETIAMTTLLAFNRLAMKKTSH
jgi:hypothetical protein